MIHHYTMRTYTAALLDLFNDLEVQYKLSDGSLKTKNIPLNYSGREKAIVMDKYTIEQILSGNINVLPRATLTLLGMQKSKNRTTNKNLKINTVKTVDSFSYSWNSVPYIVNYELIIQCRGMNELTSIIEQICPKFNPIVNIDVADAQNLSEYTRIPITLDDITWTDDEYSELSSNVFTITAQLGVSGSLYSPIREIEKIKEFKIFINEDERDGTYTKKSILNWDVEDSEIVGEVDSNIVENTETFPPFINGLVPDVAFTVGENILTGVFNDVDNPIYELNFEFTILTGSEFVKSSSNDFNSFKLDVNDDTPVGTEIEIQFKVTDVHGNFDSIDKIFVIG